MHRTLALLLGALPLALPGQELTAGQTAQILQRLDALEKQNQQLLSEIRALRELVAGKPTQETVVAQPPSDEERLDIAEQQVRDLAQSRVESDHRDPVQLTGMLLFNGFHNGRFGASEYPVLAAPASGQSTDGATIRQTIIGLKFQAPEKIAGMEVSGSAYMDFWGGTGTSLNQLMRLRVASINFAWNNTTFTVAQDKPIISPREPDSLAQVGFSPLTASGNLWIWEPQARLEQRFHFDQTAGLRAQIGVFQTTERNNVPSEYSTVVSNSRPALEGRFVFWKQSGFESQFEIAPGFHISQTHVAGFSIPSRIASIDWQAPLARKLILTGTVFHGENLGVVGGLQQGVVETSWNGFHAVRGSGGWAQLKYLATPRLTFDLFGGQEDDLNRDLAAGNIVKNETYGANAIYRVMSNVLASFEWSYLRTNYVGNGIRSNPHYDLAFAYLF